MELKKINSEPLKGKKDREVYLRDKMSELNSIPVGKNVMVAFEGSTATSKSAEPIRRWIQVKSHITEIVEIWPWAREEEAEKTKVVQRLEGMGLGSDQIMGLNKKAVLVLVNFVVGGIKHGDNILVAIWGPEEGKTWNGTLPAKSMIFPDRCDPKSVLPGNKPAVQLDTMAISIKHGLAITGIADKQSDVKRRVIRSYRVSPILTRKEDLEPAPVKMSRAEPVRQGDVLVALDGPRIGTTSLFMLEEKNVLADRNLLIIKTESLEDAKRLLGFTLTNAWKSEVNRVGRVKGNVQLYLRKEDVEKIRIPKGFKTPPELEELLEVEKKMSVLEGKKSEIVRNLML